MPYGFRLKNGKLWRGDIEVGAAYGSRKSAAIARDAITIQWTGYDRLFNGSKIVKLKTLEEA